MKYQIVVVILIVGLGRIAFGAAQATASPQAGKASTSTVAPPVAAPAAPGGILPPDYVIGPDDVLGIVFWRDKDMSADVTVRPDGRISLPLLNELQAAGLTPEKLRQNLIEAAGRYLEDPTATVVVKQINSRKVFITGQVAHPGPYPLSTSTTVLQLIAIAGGLTEFADSKSIVVMRNQSGKQTSFPFNYKDITKRRNLRQNIELKPGDTVIVP